MKIRITDLLDDYLDEDLPLDPIPEAGIQKSKSKRKSRPGTLHHRPSRAVQIAAGLVIVISLSAVAGMKLWCGGSKGASLRQEAYNLRSRRVYSPRHRSLWLKTIHRLGRMAMRPCLLPP